MELEICKNCKRLFNYIFGPDLCPKCIRLVDESKYLEKEVVKRGLNYFSTQLNLNSSIHKRTP